MAAAVTRIARLKRIDRAAVAVITLGGIAVVVSVIGILVFIAAEALPLFRSAAATLTGTIRLGDHARPASLRALGADEVGRYVYEVTPNGVVSFFHPDKGVRTKDVRAGPTAWTHGHGDLTFVAG